MTQISESDIRIVKRLGAGASSVVFKGFLFKENRFVAVKKINVFERVRGALVDEMLSSPALGSSCAGALCSPFLRPI